ncbi:MAG: hypothetical protein R3E08_10210 [Thiotrichaceae bacterium]
MLRTSPHFSDSIPSVNVITGLIKSNIPTRIALKVSNKSESRAILAQLETEVLLGHGICFI